MNKCEKFVRIILHTIKDKSLKLLSFISGRRGSNSRHPPWQGGILPLNYPRMWVTKPSGDTLN